LRLSLDTLHRVLAKNGENRLKRPRLARKGTKRYSRPVPGDRVQIDVCKIAPALYQYTAIDDCSRWKVLGLYPRRSATSTLGFLGRLLEEMPFPIQRLQTDRGLEFFAEAVQRRLIGWGIKFRPIKPRSPHLNGKVERTQRTDLEDSGRPLIQNRPTLDNGSTNGSTSGIGTGLIPRLAADRQSIGSAS